MSKQPNSGLSVTKQKTALGDPNIVSTKKPDRKRNESLKNVQ
tara:strand:- start:720 stop:845 length:126 start_codon:yes stop_codon:yes gene_type:complete